MFILGKYKSDLEDNLKNFYLQTVKVQFFFYRGFLSRSFMNQRTAGKGEGISLTPHYYFHPHHRHLDIIT